MKQKQINKICELMERTIKLNENAPQGIHYCLEFSGHINAVAFRKFRACGFGDCAIPINEYAYLDENNLGHPLSIIEHFIATEEKRQKEAQDNGTL